MNTKEAKYTQEQQQLVVEFGEDYGIEPGQMIFFGPDPKPLFEVEAAGVLLRTLADAKGIAVGSVQSHLADTITMECGITIDGYFSSAVGSANVNETIEGEAMSAQQLERLASSRAMRSALVLAGIDLVKLHRQKRSGVVQFTGPDKSYRAKLYARVHGLGKEVGLIGEFGEKALWQRQLWQRYQVDTSAQLSDELLEDFAAFLSSLRPPAGVAKAA